MDVKLILTVTFLFSPLSLSRAQAMLIYKLLDGCRKIYVKIFHCILFVLSTSAITIGIVAGIQGQDNVPPGSHAVHFYSLHAWVGLVTVALFALQVT